jgi:hypothetical protein
MRRVRLYRLVAVPNREHHPIWHNVPLSGRWCFVVARDPDDARRLAAERLTPRRFKSPWLDKTLTAVDPVGFDGPMPKYGWVGDIAGSWSAH